MLDFKDIVCLEEKKMLHKIVEMQLKYRNHFEYEQYHPAPPLSSGGTFVEERNQVPPSSPA